MVAVGWFLPRFSCFSSLLAPIGTTRHHNVCRGLWEELELLTKEPKNGILPPLPLTRWMVQMVVIVQCVKGIGSQVEVIWVMR